ncbi:hypothetical protein P389DRAFT_52332 [Cystobasidium minutum MCA 4210]|uniref:uncharacterized protein n=1 Tax=Cystobasidium minutum MCA 4210 TaxID=1397322 RepID=UPI0034CFF4BE|eukprot:jgi/Rhomi1/52332/CE52331_13937
MKLLLTSAFTALLFGCALVESAPAARPGREVIKRSGTYGSSSDAGTERIRRAQYNPKEALKYKKVKRQSAASPRPLSCDYSGPQPPTANCTSTYTSDGCTTGYYEVEERSLQLEGGRTLQSGGHVNFRYIPLSDYQGYGSYRNPDPNWNIESGYLAFDPNPGQPGAIWIGRDYFDWSAGADLPVEGYCIVWVQVDNLNPHYGEGGQGPVCYCPLASRRYRQ